MTRCSSFFLVLLLAAATAGSLATSQKGVSKENDVLQKQSSGIGLGLKQLPDENLDNPQLPVRRAGAAAHRRVARLRLRRKRRADREARIGMKDPDTTAEQMDRASGEPRVDRNDAGTEEDDANEANLLEAVELASRSQQLPQQSDAASMTADKEDTDGRAQTTRNDGEAGSGTSKEQGDMTSRTSSAGVQGPKDAGRDNAQPTDSKASATAVAAKGTAEQEAKPGLVDKTRSTGSRKSSEPLPHDGGTQEGSGDLGALDKELAYPALDAPDDEPHDSSQSTITLGRNRAADSEAEGGVQPAGKEQGDKAAGGHGGKNPRQQSGAGESQAGLDGEQSKDRAGSGSEAGTSSGKTPGDKQAGVKGDARSGKAPGGGSKAGGAKTGTGAKSGGQPGGGSKRSDAKSGDGEAGGNAKLGEQTGGSAAADVASSEKEPADLHSLRDAIALLQKGDVDDGVFELGTEDEKDDEETGGRSTAKGAAGNMKDRKDKEGQVQDKPASSSGTKAPKKSAAERDEQNLNDKAEQQKKPGHSKSEGRSAQSTGQKEGTEADRIAEESKKPDMRWLPEEEETEEEDRSAPRTFDRLLDHYKIASFLDVPCGDGDQVSNKVDHFPTNHPDDIRYIGVDEYEAKIDSAARMHGDTPNWSFRVQDLVQKRLPKADLLVSRAALLRPDMLALVDLLENFARSGAKYLLLGSFEQLTYAEPSINTGIEDGSEGISYRISLEQEPFGLDAPLQVFPEPEGFGLSADAAASIGEDAQSGKGDAKSGKTARSGNGGKSGNAANSGRNAGNHDDGESGAVNPRQMLLYSGDYLRRQDFSDMRNRVELFLDAE